jgi:hypothetical protein
MLAFILASVFAGCSSSSTDRGTSQDAPDCGIHVDRFKELVIVDDAVITDARASNTADGVWSFRRRIEEMTPPGAAPETTIANWLSSWKITTAINQFPVAARTQVDQKVLCRWMRVTPANQCDETCAKCTGRILTLEKAPFRLVGISNRLDLRDQVTPDPDTAGEARFIYGLTNGPGDDPQSAPMAMTVIFEYRQVLRGRTQAALDRQWHALGAHAAFDEAYKVDLAALLQSFTEPGAAPSRPLGNAIGQLRTNEREFDWAWDMREFVLSNDGLRLSSTENTPDLTLSASQPFAQFLTDNRAAIMAGRHALPSRLQGGAVGILSDWTAPVDSALVRAFSLETCNGCHQNHPMVDFNFHISPHRSGVAKLSSFLNNPADPTHDELARRERFLATALCAEQ